MTPNTTPRWPIFAASASVLCAVAACLMPTFSRMAYEETNTGDDTFFSLLIAMPVLLIAGLIIGWVARAHVPDPPHALFRVAIWLNAGLLLALIVFAGYGIFSYQGR